MDDEHVTKQPSEQDESDNQSNPGETNSPDDVTPDIPPDHKNLHGRLVTTAISLKREKWKGIKRIDEPFSRPSKYFAVWEQSG